MQNKNESLFANAISIEKMEPRLELAAAASKIHVAIDIETGTDTGS